MKRWYEWRKPTSGFLFRIEANWGGGKAHAVLTIHLGGSFEKHKLKDGFFLYGYAGVVRAIQRFPARAKFCQKPEYFKLLAFCLRKPLAMSDTSRKKTELPTFFRSKHLMWFDI